MDLGRWRCKDSEPLSEGLRAFCEGLELASERGTLREHVRPGLRIVGFEKRVTIAFVVDATTITVLRVFYAGVDWDKLPFKMSVDRLAGDERDGQTG